MTSDKKNYKPHWKRRRERRIFLRLIRAGLMLLLLYLLIHRLFAGHDPGQLDLEDTQTIDGIESLRPQLDVELLDYNEYSRPGTALEQVNGIVIHYTANPGTTAMQNRNYFNSLAEARTTKASSHFIIGLEGEIVQCIPCNEIAYASNSRNSDTISIECCIPDDTGVFNDATYQSMVELTAWLMVRYNLTSDDVIRHYDITGKECPKYFVENKDAWTQFRSDVEARGNSLRKEIKKNL